METPASAETLLQNPEVRNVIDNVNPGTRARRCFQPPLCAAFAKAFTTLAEDPSCRFTIDPEAKRQLPSIIGNPVQKIAATEEPDATLSALYSKKRKIGIVFSGGPAPGGHNVIAGLFDAAQKANPENEVIGFLLGPDGIIEGETVQITRDLVNQYRNMGGFTMIKTGRTKIDTAEKMSLSRNTCRQLGLDALVVVGGDDSNTNAAFLAQEMAQDGVQVIGVPKTIDGDIQVRDDDGNVLCAISFGFHSAARAFSGAINNLCTDAGSDVKYWHVCKVMGRVASHLALEVALQTHANLSFVGEELADYVDERRIQKAQAEGRVDYTAYGMTLRHLSRVICDAIVRRAAVGKNYGVLVLPEGVLEFINEIQMFIIKLNTILADYNHTHDTTFHHDFPMLRDKLEYLRKLAQRSQEDPNFKIWNTRDNDLFNDIPAFFQEGLLMERDSHGNFPFSQVKTEKVLMDLVTDYLKILEEAGDYKIGIDRPYFHKTMTAAGIDPDRFGPAVFRNYADTDIPHLMVHPAIISVKTLKQALEREGLVKEGAEIPKAVLKIFKKSLPNFKTQTHFYGYDGRGTDPTRFDCIYTYNLGQTVFSLIANGATGQMAAIRHLEQDFEKWEPIGVPIAPLMHLEERKGRLTLVIEKSVVDLRSPAFQVFKAVREQWLAAVSGPDQYRSPGPIHFDLETEESRPITLALNAHQM